MIARRLEGREMTPMRCELGMENMVHDVCAVNYAWVVLTDMDASVALSPRRSTSYDFHCVQGTL